MPGRTRAERPGGRCEVPGRRAVCAKVSTLVALAGRCLHRDVAQLGRALDWGSRGRGFKSRRPDQNMQVRGVPDFGPGPLFDLREPNGEPPKRQR